VNPKVLSCVSQTVGGVSQLRVVVVDGYPIARAGLNVFFADAPDVDVVGEAAHGEEAIRLVGETGADLVVLGFELADGPTGIEVCRSLKALPEPPRVLVLTGHNHAEAMLPFRLAGADSYLHRGSDRGPIVEAARRTACGHGVWDIGDETDATILGAAPESVGLTARELEVLTLKHHRHANADIAAALNISLHTVKRHVSSIRRKLASSGVTSYPGRR
jgi:two-component system, NarL family, response regulator DevR